KNHLYVFGGWHSGYYNDLWKFTIDTSCGSSCPAIAVNLPVASFQSNKTAICQNDCISYTDLSTGATSWQWTFQGGLPSSSADENPQVCYLDSGVYNVTLVASNSAGSDTLSNNNYINVKATPLTPNIQDHVGIGNDTLFCGLDSNYTSYQWYFD